MKATRFLFVSALIFLPGILIAAEHPTLKFDGTWRTKIVCPPKGNTEGFTWFLDSVITGGDLRGARGTEGEPGSFVLSGKIEENGSAKLTGDGFINSRKYARGIFAHKGEEYTWDVKADFKETTGTGLRNEGLGIVGRPCTFEFTKRQPGSAAPAEAPAGTPSPTPPGF
jgi:hypothetical protein